MPVTVVAGGLFGDEGKGKVAAYLALKDDIDAAVRGGVGPNAGHTVVHSGVAHRLRMLPSAVVSDRARLMIGAGVLLDPAVLIEEINRFKVESRVLVDYQCGIIEGAHIDRDKSGHLKDKIGTTGTGTGPANADRALRIGRVARHVETVAKYSGDVSLEVNKMADEGRALLLEGTQGTFLSLYHGTYPYVTSKDVSSSAICSDVGLGPKKVSEIVIVFKSFVTRVGEGPLVGELSEQEALKRGWREFGAVTGRVRSVAQFNFDLAKRAVMLNSATQIALTKLDTLFEVCRGVKKYDALSIDARRFVEEVEDATGVPVTLIGTGPETFDIIDRREELDLLP